MQSIGGYPYYRTSLRGNQRAGRMGINRKGARRTEKIYKGAGRINLIWEQGAGKKQKLERSTEKC